MVVFWLMLSCFFLLMEMGHPGLFLFLSFFFGGLTALPVAFYGCTLFVQSGVFLTTSFVVCYALRTWIYRCEGAAPKTNVHALQGKRGVVIQDITLHSSGQVKLGGEVWSARTVNDRAIRIGEAIEVVSVRGSHVVVGHITNDNS